MQIVINVMLMNSHHGTAFHFNYYLGVYGIPEMVVVVFRAGGMVEEQAQKKQVKDETLLSIFSFTCLTFYHLRLCGVLVLCGSMCGMLVRPYMWSLFHRRVR